MSRKTRTALYAVLAFVFMVLLILSMAWYNGVNPFHPRTHVLPDIPLSRNILQQHYNQEIQLQLF